MIEKFNWPLKCFPEVDNAGKFPFDDRNFAKNYCSVHHHALHLYEYSGRMQLDDREYEIYPGTMTVSPQFSNTRYHLEASGYHYCIHFRKGFSEEETCFSLPLIFSLGNYHQEAELRFLEIAGMLMYAKTGAKEQAKISLALQQFLLWLSTSITDKNDSRMETNKSVASAVDIIEKNLTDKLSVPEIAAEAKLSQNYLALLFKRQFGMTIPHYILIRRIEYAKTLLQISDMKIKEIADKSGLPDSQYFNKQFRRIVGISPSEYRKVITN